MIPELADSKYYIVSSNTSWVRVANISSKVTNTSGILIGII